MRYVGIGDPVKHVVTPVHGHLRPQQLARVFSVTSISCSLRSKIHPQTTLQRLKTPNPNAKSIAILGGGITGLTAALDLSKALPKSRITVYEAQDRLGGWINSERVDVGKENVLFEWGPRSIRPDLAGSGLATLQLIQQLDLLDQVIGIPLNAPASSNRFVYYPDHLVRMPARSPGAGRWSQILQNAYTVLREPLFKGVVGAIIAEFFVKLRDPALEDESAGDFMRRRFGRVIADNLVSGFIHGIYAGDLDRLSVRTLFPTAWYLERRDPEGDGIVGEIVNLILNRRALRSFNDRSMETLLPLLSEYKNEDLGFHRHQMFQPGVLMGSSAYTFFQGLGQLVTSLKGALEKEPHVTLRTKSKAKSLEFDPKSKKVTVHLSNGGMPQKYDYVVSTLSPQVLRASIPNHPTNHPASQGPPDFHSACDKASEAVTVMIVNLFYQGVGLLGDTRGFGYLIPRSVPVEQNPERALGVIFASETSGPPGVFYVGNPKTGEPSPNGEIRMFGQDSAIGTKLTVMIGGHWWDGWGESDLPSEEEAIQMAKRILARHLHVNTEPLVAKAKLARNAIPQYRVGYRQTMTTIHRTLLRSFEGRVKVAGPYWQGGVGINNSVQKAKEIVLDILQGWDDHTGLEDYSQKERYFLFDGRSNTIDDDRPPEKISRPQD